MIYDACNTKPFAEKPDTLVSSKPDTVDFISMFYYEITKLMFKLRYVTVTSLFYKKKHVSIDI